MTGQGCSAHGNRRASREGALREHVAALAKDQQSSTELLKQLAEHVSTLTNSAEATAARSQLALTVAAVGGVGFGFPTLFIALLR